MMRDKMERFVLLPFSAGCISESSIAVGVQQQQQPSPPPRRSSSSKPAAAAGAEIHNSSTTAIKNQEEDEESISSESMKGSFRSLPNSKPDLSTGLNRLCKGLKNFSQFFAYKEEEMEEEMEIGLPTDVMHVTHIGLDGCTTTTTNNNQNQNNNNNNNSIKGSNWENIMAPGLLSLGQFELSMAAAAPTKADDREEALPAEALVKKKKNININNSINQLN
ncbi:CRIB domain-containing protein RIC4-like [Pistacia vera]|uniref:CRIB domain-containing protein RIC4-like n=1 Tax=Pistacia vera TaxID=55513 RepID=UPI0012635001|nr:CRIB domain-containing protein RIC4-like [Pistacia vera]